MPPVKTSRSGKSKAAIKKSISAKDVRKGSEVRKTTPNSGVSNKSGSSSNKYKTAAKRRPGRHKRTAGNAWVPFIRAFALVFILGGGLLYALAPRGLDLLGLGVTDSNLAANTTAYTSGQEPPAAGVDNLFTTPLSELDAPLDPDVNPSAAQLEESIVRIDEILRRAMDQHGLTSEGLRLVDVLPSLAGKNDFLFQVLSFGEGGGNDAASLAAVDRMIRELADTLPKMRPPAAITAMAPGRWTIAVAGVPTHELVYAPTGGSGEGALGGSGGAGVSPSGENSPATPSTPGPSVAPGAPGRLVIVIDDIGADVRAAKNLLALDFPVTLAIWPKAAHAKVCAEMAHVAGREVMIHQPMEPVSYPRNKPGPGAVFVSMGAADIRAVVEANLRLVPYAVGLNNHMGSKATQDRRAVAAVLEALRGRNMFVLDSITHDHSVFYSLARQEGFPALKRDIFLDNVQNTRSILHQLNAAAHLAARKGWAVAIGHPYPQTIEALQQWQSAHPGNVRMITARELLGEK